MIPINFITKWQRHSPWAYQSQVEQDLVLSRALVMLYQNPLIQESLAFRGGTALNKLYCDSTARYSEDIDLVQINSGPIGDIMTVIRDTIDPWLGKPKYKQTSRSVKFIYRFQSEDRPSIPLRLKIEINITEPFSIFGIREKSYSVNNDWFKETSDIKTFSIEELMSSKLRALYQRAKGRDLYDLWMAISKLNVNCKEIIEGFKFYCDKQNITITRAEFEKNLNDKMRSKDFLIDANKVLPEDSLWNAKTAYKIVLSNLVEKLPGEPWKGNS